MNNLFNYIDRPSPVHRLTGATKLICLVLWSLASMLTYDTRILVLLSVLGAVLFRVSRLRARDVALVLKFVAGFTLFNAVLLYLFSPAHGCEIYGTRTVLLGSGKYALTREQLFYQVNYILKVVSTVPPVLLFVSTTQPSEFAASLNRVGVKYSIAYAVSLALRYIPDIQREYHEISLAQQARGVEMSKKANLFNRLKSASSILIPLILSSMQRIDTVSNAMELRGFGKNKKRTWYMARPFAKADFAAIALCALLTALSVTLNIINGTRFWDPFV